MPSPRISPAYRTPVFQAVGLQAILGLLSALILDGGLTLRICGVAFAAFWSGVAVMIWHRPQNPTKTDLSLIQAGSLLAIIIAWFLVPLVWELRDR